MKRKPTTQTLFVPTLLDNAGLRHIIPAKDAPAYCGANGAQRFAHDWQVAELCARCVEGYATERARARMDRFFGG